MFSAMGQMAFVAHPAGDATATKIVAVPPNTGTPVSFIVKPMKLGEIEIRLNASVMQGVISDSFKKIIRILPEEIVVVKSERIHFHHETPLMQFFDVAHSVNEKAVERSGQVYFTVYPDQQTPKHIANNYDVSLLYNDTKITLHVNSESTKNSTTEIVPNYVSNMFVIVIGSGSGFIQIDWQYRLSLMHFKPRFNLQLTKLATPTKWLTRLKVCCSFIPENRDEYSNETLVEVSIPIGYAMDDHSVLEETTGNHIRRIEVLHGGTTLMVYYHKMGNETNCFSAYPYRRYRMPLHRPSYIKVQDIYRPELNAMEMFDFY
ncbi:uncharacterized protein LOC125954321 isoform X3 [Anopheles darlingi]|uniref:uncharacterized protein LOC125954321 isoform X1 n=1 Tax=Anopheles darlingi TaxID=43151 RepID=UPI00210034FC|nr:uncharacterized protein LOC125954321 isoform X1 [Anopheles darlingi]XP_049540473.1 uncharacterized protein LOC125954321 isoform X2 [Anopheles darlingi]XP_049540474.1 uncharacterized protein LOC125954321 isoform X3 [Anopheles darlingi]